ncbi:hypothetical protein B0T26DRAFT_240377 [Lasiosphaeria miniovina]|uniref:Uncharacterized protein n=1 Tax=Lasiosphaeria miniovina TaxID=1954250 RepID=A0AA40AVX2_9PEZI|nr:uncharacterized protein B0T26DRAFT_240377 [Lasiosphaeria miniovina]KAK0722918.1 hypothetical protein B0T26DRAFT_240377 [Lasiosphaeria miniovina]
MRHTAQFNALIAETPPKGLNINRPLDKLGVSEEEREKIDWKDGLPFKLVNPDGHEYKIFLHQLADADRIDETIHGFLRGYVLATSVGLGKSLTAITTLMMRRLHWQRVEVEGGEVDAGASLLLVPANLISQFFRGQKVCRWRPKPLVYYVNAKSAATNPALAEATLTKDGFMAKMKRFSQTRHKASVRASQSQTTHFVTLDLSTLFWSPFEAARNNCHGLLPSERLFTTLVMKWGAALAWGPKQVLRNSSIRKLTLEQTAKFVIISSYSAFTARCFKGIYRKVVKGSTEAMQPHLDDQVFVS